MRNLERRQHMRDVTVAAALQEDDDVDLQEGVEVDPSSTRRQDVMLRDARALRLRLAGATYEDVAAQLGLATRKSAWEAVQRELRRRLVEPAEQLRDIELMRLDRAQVAIWKTITDPEAPFEHLDKAVKTYLQLSKRRSDLLGLDAPKKVDISRQIREMAMAEGLDPDQAIKDAETVLAQFDVQV